MLRKNWSVIVIVLLIMVIALGITISAEPKKVKLVYWTHWEQNPLFNAYYVTAGKEFSKLHPECEGVEVVTIPYSGYEAKYLSTFMAKTGAPDIFNGAAYDWAGRYQFADEMPSSLAKNVDENAVNSALNAGVFNGVRYGIPVEGGNFMMMYINTDMYKEAGLDPNKPPTTFTELLEHAKKLTKYDANGKVIRSGYGIRYSGNQTGITDKFLPTLHAFGGIMVDLEFKKGSGFVNSPAAIEALTFYGDLVNKYKVSSLEVGNSEVAFGKGLAAIIFRESWLAGWMEQNAPDIKYKVYALPSQKVAPGPGALFLWADMVYQYSPNKELAWEFMRFMWSKENDLGRSQAQGLTPVMKACFETDVVKARPEYNAVIESNKRPPAPNYSNPKTTEITYAYGDAVLDVIYGKKDAKTALDEAAVKIDQILKQ